MTNATVRVVATSGGSPVIDSLITTGKNGFLDLWLPRNRKIYCTLESGGKQAADTVFTFDSSKTCITTFRLQ
jgi:hypothetical protein